MIPPLFVLAGGFGTRLRAAVTDVPKPLAPVGDEPFLHYLVERWVEQGVTRLVFLLHHQANAIETFLESLAGDGRLNGCDFLAVTEAIPLGTGGAVAHAIRHAHVTETFLVANADTWLGSGIELVADTSPPAMAVVSVGNTERYGTVRLERDVVAAFEEKRSSAGAGRINAGLYHLSADLFGEWNGLPFSLERDLFPKLAGARQLRAVRLESDFIDIGIPEDYYRFCRWIESGKAGVL